MSIGRIWLIISIKILIDIIKCNLLKKFNISIFKECKTIKSITKKYIFARKINDEWQESNGNSRKFDKLFISKKWYNENHSKEKDKIELEPSLIYLEDDEMFTDRKLIDIEFRCEWGNLISVILRLRIL